MFIKRNKKFVVIPKIREYKEDFYPHRGEVNDRRKFGYFLQTLGYIPVDRQVNSFFRAGQKILDLDENYDTTDDDPVDDKTLDVRDWELEEIGHAMVQLQQKAGLTDSSAQSETTSKIEQQKNIVTSTPGDSGAEN